jgi:hypothetical protein
LRSKKCKSTLSYGKLVNCSCPTWVCRLRTTLSV